MTQISTHTGGELELSPMSDGTMKVMISVKTIDGNTLVIESWLKHESVLLMEQAVNETKENYKKRMSN